MKVEALVDPLPHTLAEEKAEKLNTMAKVKAQSLVHALADTIAEVELKALGDQWSIKILRHYLMHWLAR